MDLAREYRKFCSFYPRMLVSILVLMDLAREFPIHLSRNPAFHSFNPCFNGSCSRMRPLFQEYQNQRFGFQSLF